MADYWSKDNFKLNDALNGELWDNSPMLHRLAHSANGMPQSCDAGLQQAMIDPGFTKIRTWVPDLVGKDWQDKEAVIVVGSAYAPFIGEHSSRVATMSLNEYVSCINFEDFQQTFLRKVVQRDQNYYGKIPGKLPQYCEARHLVVTDLCKGSFCVRGEHTGSGDRYVGGDKTAEQHCERFEMYTERSAMSDFTWRRIMGSESSTILALGRIAEHGLLRLFAHHGMDIAHSATGTLWTLTTTKAGKWVQAYADHRRTIGQWIETGDYWLILDIQRDRSWKVYVRSHPNARRRPV